MVESVRRWLARANTKQKQYLANLFTIAAGGIMLSVWQSFYGEAINFDLNFLKNVFFAIFSFSLCVLGYNCLTEDQT